MAQLSETVTARTGARPLADFAYMSFDVVGTLIDFEGAIRHGLLQITEKAGLRLDIEEALVIYREARHGRDAGLFPDDLGRCFGIMAERLELPDSHENRVLMIEALGNADPFPDSAVAMASLGKHYKLIAMTNARRWAYERYSAKLGNPFFAAFTTDDTGCEKPDPAFFNHVFNFIESHGGSKDGMLHTAQSQHHDIGISRALGMTNVWIQRRHARPGYGGTLEPEKPTTPDYHFHSLADLAEAADRAFG